MNQLKFLIVVQIKAIENLNTETKTSWYNFLINYTPKLVKKWLTIGQTQQRTMRHHHMSVVCKKVKGN